MELFHFLAGENDSFLNLSDILRASIFPLETDEETDLIFFPERDTRLRASMQGRRNSPGARLSASFRSFPSSILNE